MLAMQGAQPSVFAQEPGERSKQAEGIRIINPRVRVPVGLIIIDDSTGLVNPNRFALPQFNAAWRGENKTYPYERRSRWLPG